MKLKTVKSSMIHAVGYDKSSQELEVEFNSGEIYRYIGVGKQKYEGLIQADSKGRYMQDNIIDYYDCYRKGVGRRQK